MVRRRVPLVTLTLVAVGLVAGGLWWWAVVRLLLVPGETGPVEGAVAAGGWGLSLLPVHVAASSGRSSSGRSSGHPSGRSSGRSVTRASRRRRWGAGSGPS
ncbi:hypothetical protein ACIGEZ_33395 [Streptomyces sp. NPDC085481]|uniref:hypothetical protein n=1 Tax=Streptomyces sp. NPDC085481 TaxID=3365727 RepID=UPI0037D2C1C8